MSAKWQRPQSYVQRLQRDIVKASLIELRDRGAWIASTAFGEDRVVGMIAFAELECFKRSVSC